jgi:thiosulfate/3-mercaptopyruvate sulfurtransferase
MLPGDRAMRAMKSHGRPELLADPDWLWEHRDDPDVRVVDCATSDAHERAHIPGAVRIPVHPWLKTEPDPYSHLNEPLHVISADDFASAMGEIGVSNDTTVVAYDGVGHHWATRLWWVLAYYGHRNAKILDGGFHRWLTEGRPLSDAVPDVEPASFVARPDESQIVRLDELLARYDEPGVQVVNALWPDFYAGRADPFGNRRVGHIPGSINLPLTDLLTDEEPPVLKRRPPSGSRDDRPLPGRDRHDPRRLRPDASGMGPRALLRRCDGRMGEPDRHPSCRR